MISYGRVKRGEGEEAGKREKNRSCVKITLTELEIKI